MSPSKLPPPLAVLLSVDLPSPFKAAAGLALQALEDARALPNRISELPMSLVTALMQRSLQAQQQYTELVTKGEQFINTLRGPSEEVPEWATFDEDLPDAAPPSPRPSTVTTDRPDATGESAEAGPTPTPIGDESAAAGPIPAVPKPAVPKRASTAGKKATTSKTAPATRKRTSAAARKKAPAKAAGTTQAARSTTQPSATPVSDTRGEPFNRVRPAGIGPGSSFDQQALADLPIARRRTRKPKPAGDTVSSAAPVDGFKDMTLPQIRARVKSYDAATLRSLIDYEKTGQNREPVLKILDTRLSSLRPQD